MNSGFDWIADLSPSTRSAILAQSSTGYHRDGTMLYQQGDETIDIFQIISGQIRQFIVTEDGQEVLLYVYNAGDIVTDVSALDRKPYPVSIATRGETTLRIWSVQTFNKLRKEHPEIDTALAFQMVKRVRALLVLIEEMSTLPVSARVAGRMLALAEVNGRSDLRISQSDLGLMCGATRQSVNESLRIMKAANLISSEYGRITIRDPDGLRLYKTVHRRGL